MAITLSQRSNTRLDGAHPDIRRIIERAAAISPIDFTVLEVLRTVEQQRKNVANGVSRTMRSRHLAHPSDGLSRAVDIAPMIDGEITWAWPIYPKLAAVIKQAAKDVGVPIEWGGDWKKLRDGPHWQLPWASYP
jgi:peptidoglycan L-alanyl-D-glutamate endopeptidase CwlK